MVSFTNLKWRTHTPAKNGNDALFHSEVLANEMNVHAHTKKVMGQIPLHK